MTESMIKILTVFKYGRKYYKYGRKYDKNIESIVKYGRKYYKYGRKYYKNIEGIVSVAEIIINIEESIVRKFKVS